MGVSAPAPPLSFVHAGRNALSVSRPSLWGRFNGVLLRHLRGGVAEWRTPVACMGAGQAMGRLEGFTMQRQSRSPRARPSTSISAVAMLLAKGMLFWSHRREI